MGRDYDITNAADMRRFQRDLEKTTNDIVKKAARGAQNDARIRCSIHGEYTQVRQTDALGSFQITGCCDEVVQLAYAAAGRHFN
jgi:hypothetical protein